MTLRTEHYRGVSTARGAGDDAHDVTVVVPTHRRPDGLGAVLAGLAAQKHPGVAWRVVVVDNADNPSAAPTVAAADLPVPVDVVHEPTPGAAAARNRGIRSADTGLVAFLDDDVVPAEDWLVGLIEPIIADRCDATGGRVVLDPDVARPWWFEDWMSGYYAGYEHADTEVDVRTIAALKEPYVLTASAAFRRADLDAIDGFDERLGPRRGVQLVNDDVDLCRRLLARGARIHVVPSSVVVHELPVERLRFGFFVRRLYSQGRSDWLIDRASLRSHVLGGAGGAVLGWLRFVLGPLLRPRYLIAETAKRAGWVREALADAIDRRSP